MDALPKKIPDSPSVLILLIAGAAFTVALALGALTLFAKKSETAQSEQTPPPALALNPALLTAKAAIVYDPLEKRVLFQKNAYEALPLASLTKLMTAQTVLRLEEDDKPIFITERDLLPEGDSGLRAGETWSLHELLRLGLVASANDAMAAAAAAASPHIIDEMNLTAQNLGLTETSFLNPTGLDENLETAGAYGSAYDTALLATAFLAQHPALFESTAKHSVTIRSGTSVLEATSTDTPILDIPGLVAAKTGYTDLAGGNLVAVFDIEIGRPVVVAVLGSTREARFSDVRTLIDAVRRADTLQIP